MNVDERVTGERERLKGYLETLVGPEVIARFDEALTHPSFANEADVPDNQRLEFLGDAVLGLCVSEMLAVMHPDADEGKLTRMRSALVNSEALATWARRVGIGACVAFGRGAGVGSEREQASVLADATEALIAAVYESHGLPGARALVRDVVTPMLQEPEALESRDPKSALQEMIQGLGWPAPTYRVAQVRGAAHEPLFEVEVDCGGGRTARGEGRSKRLAERAAAAEALRKLGPE